MDWTAVLGGDFFEEMTDMLPLEDGGFVAVGHTGSRTGRFETPQGNVIDPVAPQQETDLLAARYTADGVLVWQSRIGGNRNDRIFGIDIDRDGNLVLAGESNSDPTAGGSAKSAPLADAAPPNGNAPNPDIWVVKLRPDGTKIADFSYGTATYQSGAGVAVLNNGNYIIAGTTNTQADSRGVEDGQTLDYLVLTVSSDGTFIDSTRYGGGNYDRVFSIQKLAGGGVLVGGGSASSTALMGKTNVGYGNADAYIVHLDATGQYLRDYQFGGRFTEQAFVLREYLNGDIFLGCESINSPVRVAGQAMGNRTSPQLGPDGDTDAWYLRFVPTDGGPIVWQNIHGGNRSDNLLGGVMSPSDCIVLVGSTRSAQTGTTTTFDHTLNGGSDAWLWQITGTGEVTWDVTHGGESDDKIEELYRLGRGNLIMGGLSASDPFDWKLQPRQGPRQTFDNINFFFPNDMWFASLTCSYRNDIGMDLQTCVGDSVNLNNLLESEEPGCTYYRWKELKDEEFFGRIIQTSNVVGNRYRFASAPDTSVTYIHEVFSPDGCVVRDTVEVLVGKKPVATVTPIDPACGVPGNAFVSAPGATALRLASGATFDRDTATFFNLPVGRDTVFAESLVERCGSFTMFNIGQGTALDLQLLPPDDVCAGVPVTVPLPADARPLTYRWLDASTGNEICVGCDDYTETYTQPDTYNIQLEVEDPDGCVIVEDVAITVHRNATITGTSSIDPTCTDPGSITVTISGGGDVQLRESGDVVLGPTVTFSTLTAGDYTVFALSGSPSCEDSARVTLAPPTDLSFDIGSDLAYCQGETTVTLIAPVEVQGLAFEWVDLATDAQLSSAVDFAPSSAVAGTLRLGLKATTADGCVVVDSIAVLVAPAPVLSIDNVSAEGCAGDADGSFSVSSSEGPFFVGGVRYDVSQNLTGLLPGSYIVSVPSTLARCADEQEVVIAPGETFEVELGENQVVFTGTEVVLDPRVANPSDYTYLWSGAEGLCPDCPTQRFPLLADARVTVEVTNAAGCTMSDFVLLNAREDKRIYIPSAFSPNGDFINDRFGIFLTPFVSQTGSLRVFNRWGAVVYEGLDDGVTEAAGWDGTLNGERLPSGVYVYVIPITFRDGEERIFRGEVNLLR